MGPLTRPGPPRVSPDPSWTFLKVPHPSQILQTVPRPVQDLPVGPPTRP